MIEQEEIASTAPQYRIGTVTRLTGLSADVVRVWERRYKAVTPVRSDGGTRLYSEADVARLRKLRQAIDKGYSIGQAARLSTDQLESVLRDREKEREGTDPYSAVRTRFLDAIKKMDVVAADLELSRAATLFPARVLIMKIVSPILAEIGERWSHKELGAAHEHLASGLLRNLLCAMFRLYPPDEQAETIIFTTPPGERHEFGLLLAAMTAAMRGWRVVYLGPDLPASEVVNAVRLTGSRFLALSVANENPHLETELKTLASSLPPSTRVWIGGAEAVNHRNLVHDLNWVLIRDLEDLDDRLRR
ncbi:MAG TPA: MerR family transcriptional regulator [Blastocatellia bacterium]|jgi:DNA-binding transcriptional MerR regulator